MGRFAWKDRRDMLSMNCVTKESCASTGRSSKMVSRQTQATCVTSPQDRVIYIGCRAFSRDMCNLRMRLIELMKYRNRCPFEDELYRGDLLAKSQSQNEAFPKGGCDHARLIP